MSSFYKFHLELTSKVEDKGAPVLFKIKAFLPNPLLKEYVPNYEIWSKKTVASQEAEGWR